MNASVQDAWGGPFDLQVPGIWLLRRPCRR